MGLREHCPVGAEAVWRLQMTDKERTIIRCAYADLQGSLDAYLSMDTHQHDWKAHKLTLQEMLEEFPWLEEE